MNTAATVNRPRRATGRSVRRLGLLGALLALCSMAFGSTAPSASAVVEWQTRFDLVPTYLTPGKQGWIRFEFGNSGDENASGPPTLTIDLPPSVSATTDPYGFNGWSCSGTAPTVTCVASVGAGAHTIGSGGALALPIEVSPSALAPEQITLSLTGGGGAPNIETRDVHYRDTPLGFGLTPGSLVASALDGYGGEDYTQAGGHPFIATSKLHTNILRLETDFEVPLIAPEAVRTIHVDLPPGFVGNPQATPRCSQAEFADGFDGCPANSAIGTVFLHTPKLQALGLSQATIFNLEPPAGLPAQFGWIVPDGRVTINPTVRSDGDYGITMEVNNITAADTLVRSEVTIWGVPSRSAHDFQRCQRPNEMLAECVGFLAGGLGGNPTDPTPYLPHEYTAPPKAFLTMPTNCADHPLVTYRADSWSNPIPDRNDIDDPRWYRETIDDLPSHTDCEKVPFDPSMTLQPETDEADSATGLKTEMHFDRSGDSDPEGQVQAHLKEASITLPEGLSLSPTAANGLDGCSSSEIGLRSAPGEKPIRFDNEEPNCPDASKIGSGEVTSPLLEDPLRGEVFLAAQDDNPFNATYAIYLVVREPSILVKLAGEVDVDQTTGQISTTFDNNPQLPFEDLRLNLYGGERANLATPMTCGTYTSQVQLTPWSAKDPDDPTPAETVQSPDSFDISSGAEGAPCAHSKAQLPFDLGVLAGSHVPLAGQTSPFSFRITRGDGNQELDSLRISPPPGFTASLRGVPYCPEGAIAAAAAKAGKAEQASPSCPPASRIGTTLVGAGPGSKPLYTPGKLYLAGPYKGSPLSVVAITPAVAGPFDLGNVVLRSALGVDPRTARITAHTDPLPRVIEGVPLRIRDIRVNLDRPHWAQNPTSCKEMAVDIAATSTEGALSTASTRFQLSGCRALQFKPRLALRLYGGTGRAAHPALRAVVRPRPGNANISRAAVKLPRSAFLDQAHIRTICTRVQFAAGNCPKAAIYGRARAWTPLLDQPLQGPVYLRSSDNNLPDMVADLRGPAHQPIRVELAGRIDSVRGGIRNTFDVVPDAPVSRFVLRMQGGKKGLITNSRNLCARTSRAVVRLNAQNGRRHNFRPRVVAVRCKKAKQRKAKRSRARHQQPTGR